MAFIEAVEAGNFEAAHLLVDQGEAVFRRLDPQVDDPELLYVRGTVLSKQKRLVEAESFFRRALAASTHKGSDWIQAVRSLARSVLWQKRCTEAQQLYLEALAQARASYGDSHAVVGTVWNDLGTAYADAGKLRSALAALEQSRLAERGAMVLPHNALITRKHQLVLATRLAPSDDGVAQLRALLGELLKLPNTGATVAQVHRDLAETLLLLNRPEEAAAEAALHSTLLQARLKPDHPDLALALCLEGRVAEQRARPDLARGSHRQSLDRLTEAQRATYGTCARLGLARLSEGRTRSELLNQVIGATAADETMTGRMMRAEAFELGGDLVAARTSLLGIEGQAAEQRRERLGAALPPD